MIPSFRWFGPSDVVTLKHIRQAGVQGVVTALHDHRCDDIWSRDTIAAHRQLVEAAGMKWHVVESLPVHESIKQGSAERDAYITRPKVQLRGLLLPRARYRSCGTTCYRKDAHPLGIKKPVTASRGHRW